MAVSVLLQFGDNDAALYSNQYLVTQCHYRLCRPYNSTRPDGLPYLNEFELLMPAPGMEDLFLYEWYIERMALSGRIVFDFSNVVIKDDSGQKSMYFEDACCYSMEERYQINNNMKRQLAIKVYSPRVKVSDINFELIK